MYTAETNGFTVAVEPCFIAKEKASGSEYYVYSYTVTISNNSPESCQLLSRHWIIRDGTGHEEHVMGEGVVGRQPVIRPGESYTYRSGCPLATPTGSMRGSYQLVSGQQRFEIRIPLFFLRPDIRPRSDAAAEALN